MSTEPTEDRLSFLGIPVTGSINHGYGRGTEQRPLSDLEPLFLAVIEDPYIREFGWTQYTPYFNDGETCYFRVGTLWFLTTDDTPRDEMDDWEEEEYGVTYGEHPTLGEMQSEGYGSSRVDLGYKGSREAEYKRAEALSNAIDSGAYGSALLTAFGDHATVYITREGITVEHYDHE